MYTDKSKALFYPLFCLTKGIHYEKRRTIKKDFRTRVGQ